MLVKEFLKPESLEEICEDIYIIVIITFIYAFKESWKR